MTTDWYLSKVLVLAVKGGCSERRAKPHSLRANPRLHEQSYVEDDWSSRTVSDRAFERGEPSLRASLSAKEKLSSRTFPVCNKQKKKKKGIGGVTHPRAALLLVGLHLSSFFLFPSGVLVKP